MSADRPPLYKGFELYALVFSRTFSRFDGHSLYAEGFDTAVRISAARPVRRRRRRPRVQA